MTKKAVAGAWRRDRLERLVRELPSQGGGTQRPLFSEGLTLADFRDRHRRLVEAAARWYRDEMGFEGD